LFFGNYPNAIEKNLNVFYRNLIYQFADMGIECTVIDPVSLTKYKSRIKAIPLERSEKTSKGSKIRVIAPRYLSFSSKKLGLIDTHVWTVKAYRKAAIKQVEKYSLDFDATYGHFINIGGIPACKVGEMYDKPCFVANGESDLRPSTYNYSSPYDLKAFKKCTGVISVSSKNRDELNALQLIEPEKIKVFPNAVDHEIFFPRDKQKCREELHLPQEDVIGCFVGGFSERKGDKRVLAAAANIKNLKLAFAGSGNEKPSGPNVVFCDSIKHDDIPVLLSASDFFVLPTLNEGCCNSIVEAMACGLPVISSDLSFNDDILNKRNSIRVNPMSIDELHEALVMITENEMKRKKMAAEAVYAADGLRIEKRAEQILGFMNMMGGK
jgi:glycosyltransferase involved in cell wall biosynthesis